jgi:hypothetical protein
MLSNKATNRDTSLYTSAGFVFFSLAAYDLHRDLPPPNPETTLQLWLLTSFHFGFSSEHISQTLNRR